MDAFIEQASGRISGSASGREKKEQAADKKFSKNKIFLLTKFSSYVI
jgi:hypothetical protein